MFTSVGFNFVATCMREQVRVHVRADMNSRERAVIGMESRAVSAWVTKHVATIYVKHVIIWHRRCYNVIISFNFLQKGDHVAFNDMTLSSKSNGDDNVSVDPPIKLILLQINFLGIMFITICHVRKNRNTSMS